jgi:hypothetical protein
MLERRNFLRENRVHAITTVVLPRFPPLTVLRPLVMRLHQRLSIRPSNYALSLVAHFKEYYDAYV